MYFGALSYIIYCGTVGVTILMVGQYMRFPFFLARLAAMLPSFVTLLSVASLYRHYNATQLARLQMPTRQLGARPNFFLAEQTRMNFLSEHVGKVYQKEDIQKSYDTMIKTIKNFRVSHSFYPDLRLATYTDELESTLWNKRLQQMSQGALSCFDFIDEVLNAYDVNPNGEGYSEQVDFTDGVDRSAYVLENIFDQTRYSSKEIYNSCQEFLKSYEKDTCGKQLTKKTAEQADSYSPMDFESIFSLATGFSINGAYKIKSFDCFSGKLYDEVLIVPSKGISLPTQSQAELTFINAQDYLLGLPYIEDFAYSIIPNKGDESTATFHQQLDDGGSTRTIYVPREYHNLDFYVESDACFATELNIGIGQGVLDQLFQFENIFEGPPCETNCDGNTGSCTCEDGQSQIIVHEHAYYPDEGIDFMSGFAVEACADIFDPYLAQGFQFSGCESDDFNVQALECQNLKHTAGTKMNVDQYNSLCPEKTPAICGADGSNPAKCDYEGFLVETTANCDTLSKKISSPDDVALKMYVDLPRNNKTCTHVEFFANVEFSNVVNNVISNKSVAIAKAAANNLATDIIKKKAEYPDATDQELIDSATNIVDVTTTLQIDIRKAYAKVHYQGEQTPTFVPVHFLGSFNAIETFDGTMKDIGYTQKKEKKQETSISDDGTEVTKEVMVRTPLVSTCGDDKFSQNEDSSFKVTHEHTDDACTIAFAPEYESEKKSSDDDSGLSGGEIAAIVVGSVAGVALLGVAFKVLRSGNYKIVGRDDFMLH